MREMELGPPSNPYSGGVYIFEELVQISCGFILIYRPVECDIQNWSSLFQLHVRFGYWRTNNNHFFHIWSKFSQHPFHRSTLRKTEH